jgi:GDP-4-dehydro-6-deoxy-D-mannose reductase
MSGRYLITGAQGLIGRDLAAHLLASDPSAIVVGIGRSPRNDFLFTHRITFRGTARPAPVPHTLANCFATARYDYRSLALSDTDALRRIVDEVQPVIVFHLASALHSADERDLASTNIDGTTSLVRALEGSSARIVLGSSASVYGEPQRVPVDETHPCVPVNAYGLSKYTAERAALRYGRDVVIARIFNVVGPGQSEDHVCGRLASELVSAPRGRPLTLAMGPLEPTRDFIDVRDVAAALVTIAERAAPGSVINVASGLEVSVRDLLRALVRIANVEVTLIERGDTVAGVSRCVADVARLRQLGFHSAYPLEQSLRDLVEWYQQLATGLQRHVYR